MALDSVGAGFGAVGNRTYRMGATEIPSPPNRDYVKGFTTENPTNTRRTLLS